MAGNKLTLSMTIKNEAGRYLREALEEHRRCIDEAVIIDDGSTDGSAEVCIEALNGIPFYIVRNETSKFSNEIELRRQQWDETVRTDPVWILNLDADEIFEGRFRSGVKSLISQTNFDVVAFRLYDFWDSTRYRDDFYWRAHNFFTPFLIRYNKNFDYRWRETPQHCGRFPENVLYLPRLNSDIRLRHLGWARAEDRMEKYARYAALDPEARYGWKEQYDSILDESPNLVEWTE